MPIGFLQATRSLKALASLGLVAALALSTLLAAGCGPGKDTGGTGDPGAGGSGTDPASGGGIGSSIGLRHHPLPVISQGQNLLAFVGDDGVVYVWDGATARGVYGPPDGNSVRGLALSPTTARPYLAVTEDTLTERGPIPTRVVIVDLVSGAEYQAAPLGSGSPAHGPAVSTLEWSANGLELFVNGEAPMVLSIGPEAATLAWDLADIIAEGSEMREPLMAPDFSRLAFSLFEQEPDDTGEDLWVADRPVSGISAGDSGSALARRLTTGNLGGYPVLWLGTRADGSDPAGRQIHVLVRLGAVSTGGGTSTGLAVVNTDTGAVDTWYGEGNLVHRPVLVDLEGGWALIGLHHSMTGRDGRTFWTPLRGTGDETSVTALDDLIAGTAVQLADGQVVLLARDPESGATGIWLVARDGSATQVGAPAAGEDAYLLEGTISGQAVVLTVATDAAGVSRCALNQIIAEEARVEAVVLQEAED